MTIPFAGRRPAGDLLQPLLAAILAIISVTVVVVFLAYTWPERSAPEVGVRLAAPLATLREGEAVRFEAPVGTQFIVRGGGREIRDGTAQAGWLVRHRGKLLALAVNGHLGCSVNFQPVQANFIDPCTGSQFALDGGSLGGPGSVGACATGLALGFPRHDRGEVREALADPGPRAAAAPRL